MLRTLIILTLISTGISAESPKTGVQGDWREPGGSVIHIAPCGADLCATLVHISPQAPSRLDIHNPDPAKDKDPLCGLRIGTHFHPTGPDHAEGGELYDPKTGKTYHGEMTAKGDRLDLRGYIGISLFGRSEQWNRVPAEPVCSE